MTEVGNVETENRGCSLGWVAQLVTLSSQYTTVAGLTPSQGTHKNQPMSA